MGAIIANEKRQKELNELISAAERTLERLLQDNPDKVLHLSQWKKEAEQLSAEYSADYEELKRQREESKDLFRIQAQIDSVLKERERIQEQQARQQKKDEMNRE